MEKLKKLLIADHEPITIGLMSLFAKRNIRDYTIITASTGEQAYHELEKGVNAAIFDGRMENGTKYNGPTLLDIAINKLPEEKRLCPTRAVLFTGHSRIYTTKINTQLRKLGLEGKVKIFYKPIEINHVIFYVTRT